jgi:RNA polymerase sigma-70 factor, ECF subfamily
MKSETGETRKHTYDELVTIVYGDLRRRASRQMAGERADSLRPTLLIHAAYERMLNYNMDFENSEHFLNVAATAMRRVLVERARKIKAAKRGAGIAPASLEDVDVTGIFRETPELLIDLDRALETLRPEQIELTELRFYAGFTIEETAEIMKLKPETVKKRWEVVRTILFDKLETSARSAATVAAAPSQGRRRT